MKPKSRFLQGCMAVALTVPAVADTIYSNLLDTPIPTDFTGVTLSIDGGTINPFFGGVGVANNNLFQPVRSGAGNLDPLSNLSVGSVIDVSDIFSTGYGGSQTHLGTTFTAGQEGNIGFKLNGTNYGWMRVVFTGNTSGAVIKDWAYDNSGQAIVVGRVNQSAASGGAQLVTLSPGTGESFTLGSMISNTGGNTNSVLKTGAGTTIINQSNTYTGATTVSNGALVINGNISTSMLTTVTSGASLSGSGTTGDLTVLSGGTLAPGDGLESLGLGAASFAGGSTYAYEFQSNLYAGSASLAGDLTYSSGTLAIGSGTILTLTDLAVSTALLDGTKFTLISSFGAWNGGLFTYLGTPLTDDSTFVIGLNEWKFDYNDSVGGGNFIGNTTGATNFVTMTVVPEPNVAALLGGLGLIALLRRQRGPQE
ncbi:MAG: autotransporter-associated beta strand repeat-containing protein [Verrucomicrobiota bacterium]